MSWLLQAWIVLTAVVIAAGGAYPPASGAASDAVAPPPQKRGVRISNLGKRYDHRRSTRCDMRRPQSTVEVPVGRKFNPRRLNPAIPGVLPEPDLKLAESDSPQTDAASHVDEEPRAARRSMWLSREEIARLPLRGIAWEQILNAAYSEWGAPKLSNQNYDHNTNVLAGALVAVRLDDHALAAKVRSHLALVPGTEEGGTTLALSRNLLAYVVAAGLVDFDDPNFDRWLSEVRQKNLRGKTLISTHEVRPNNWGTHAGASRIAAAIYLGDTDDLHRAAKVFSGWLGDRSAYCDFRYKDLSWQANPSEPVGINPAGATKEGHNIDGALPDDMRRGGSFHWPPGRTNYPWAALNGVVIQAELLHRQGFDAWNWSDQAIRRSVAFLERVGWYVTGEDEEWLVHLVNRRYGTSFRAPDVARLGKNFGWTDWTHASPAP